ncbi:hypothetical protein BS50DRAFT_629004 [Corynespora cassiicola Philippines]|uniref:Sulfate transporter family protein-like protein n=1 Tax=Corynespora cassiicola Philippines TaxID=1448308 RepID=A0A2T2P5E7_CORCC|nr:hypothetical protein BS50DRAFT_629004 [Corynespora cassiicola Philippines]
MPARFLPRRPESSASRQETFPGDGNEGDSARDHSQDQGSSTLPRSRPIRAQSSASNSILSGSYSSRNPVRSFAHQASHNISDTPQYSSHGVRERTQELASYALDSEPYQSRRRGPSFTESGGLGADIEGRRSSDSFETDAIVEDCEPESPATIIHEPERASGTFFSPMSRFSDDSRHQETRDKIPHVRVPDVVVQDTERTPLLPKPRLSRVGSHTKKVVKRFTSRSSTPSLKDRLEETFAVGRDHVAGLRHTLLSPKTYTKESALAGATAGVQMISAVFLGLLLNILDALSYGYILFPLGSPIFSQTGPDGISIFFVSCIVSQLCYSLGLSIFRGGVGSEMIEVVPFFHKMAYSIMARMEGESSEAIIATVITSYCVSSIVTGIVFFALGAFKWGNIVNFFPRHILIGCIGGVGFFLFVTGIEVSARLEGNLNYDLATLQKLFSGDTVALWILPLALGIFLCFIRKVSKSQFILPVFFIGSFAIFYIIVKGILRLDLETARQSGWIFEKPESGVPFYRFYSYFKFGSVDVGALASTIPTMLALSFFGILHVPINIPALGAAVKEDNVNINRELIAHGISNTLSGCVGSIQNYLVYTNSILFVNNGGDSRAAGVLLAVATGAVWVAGPAMIGFIPICLVGALIFMLGIDLMEEAIWDTYGRCHRLEYLTIIVMVVIMGAYDFVVGIFVGIALACLNYVVQTSRTPAVRASYSGNVTESTVRRPPLDRRYLKAVRNQIQVLKLSGFLFFGTIVSVERIMRSLVEGDAFQKQPISFIIVDFKQVTGADLSSTEVLQRINRVLNEKNVKMILSGVSFDSQVGHALQNVGLLDVEAADPRSPPPQVFEDLNTALEACENELLESFYKHWGTTTKRQVTPPMSIAASESAANGQNGASPASSLRVNPLDPSFASPRRGARIEAARRTISEEEADFASIHEPDRQTSTIVPSKWKNFAQPLKIILQTFEESSSKNEDFWIVLKDYLERKEYPAGTILYSRGDEPDGFYILESGRFKTQYQLDQGQYTEVILPGTTCGELPFFSETDRTGTVEAERDSVAWLLTREQYKRLEADHRDVAAELLKVGLKLTKERMDTITSYVLVTAS